MGNESAKDQDLRQHVLYLLRGGGAHMDFNNFIAHLPFELINKKVEGLPYTIWQVLEHMRIAQWDILEFCLNANHRSPNFPQGYWPPPDNKSDVVTWRKTIQEFSANLEEMEKLITNPKTNLFARIPHGEGQTILREALLLADHNSYHLGALVVMTRIIAGVDEEG